MTLPESQNMCIRFHTVPVLNGRMDRNGNSSHYVAQWTDKNVDSSHVSNIVLYLYFTEAPKCHGEKNITSAH